VAVYVPAPLGLPLQEEWSKAVKATWFAVIAVTYMDVLKEGG
jgi:hypothetical protein